VSLVLISGTLLVPMIFTGPIYRISYDSLMIMPKLRSTYDGRLIYKTERKAFLRYDSVAIS